MGRKRSNSKRKRTSVNVKREGSLIEAVSDLEEKIEAYGWKFGKLTPEIPNQLLIESGACTSEQIDAMGRLWKTLVSHGAIATDIIKYDLSRTFAKEHFAELAKEVGAPTALFVMLTDWLGLTPEDAGFMIGIGAWAGRRNHAKRMDRGIPALAESLVRNLAFRDAVIYTEKITRVNRDRIRETIERTQRRRSRELKKKKSSSSSPRVKPSS